MHNGSVQCAECYDGYHLVNGSCKQKHCKCRSPSLLSSDQCGSVRLDSWLHLFREASMVKLRWAATALATAAFRALPVLEVALFDRPMVMFLLDRSKTPAAAVIRHANV